MNGYEEKIKDCLFLEVCNAAGREEWDGLAHQQKENLMLVCRLSGYDEKFQRDCGLVTREQMEHWGIEEEVLFQDAWANMFAKRPPVLMDFEDAYGHNYDQNILAMEKKTERIWRTDADFYVLTNNMDHGAGVHDGRGNAAEISRKAGWKSDRPSGIHPRCVSYGGEGRSGHGTAEGWGIWSKQGVPGCRLSVR